MTAAALTANAATNFVMDGNFGAVNNLNYWTIQNPSTYYSRFSDAPYVPPVAPTGLSTYFWSEEWTGVYASVNKNNPGNLTQKISGLTIGKTYTLSFYSTGTDWMAPQEQAYWSVNFMGSAQKGIAVVPDVGNTQCDDTGACNSQNPLLPQSWTRSFLDFVATSSSGNLVFNQVNVPDARFSPDTVPGSSPALLFLTGVILVEASAPVPEPSPLALGSAGLITVGFLIRRSRRSRGAQVA